MKQRRAGGSLKFVRLRVVRSFVRFAFVPSLLRRFVASFVWRRPAGAAAVAAVFGDCGGFDERREKRRRRSTTTTTVGSSWPQLNCGNSGGDNDANSGGNTGNNGGNCEARALKVVDAQSSPNPTVLTAEKHPKEASARCHLCSRLCVCGVALADQAGK